MRETVNRSTVECKNLTSYNALHWMHQLSVP